MPRRGAESGSGASLGAMLSAAQPEYGLCHGALQEIMASPVLPDLGEVHVGIRQG